MEDLADLWRSPLCAALAVSIELFSHQYPPRRFGAPWASVCELRIDALHVNVDDDLRLVWTYFLDDELQIVPGLLDDTVSLYVQHAVQECDDDLKHDLCVQHAPKVHTLHPY